MPLVALIYWIDVDKLKEFSRQKEKNPLFDKRRNPLSVSALVFWQIDPV
jgi:hypothetical protein